MLLKHFYPLMACFIAGFLCCNSVCGQPVKQATKPKAGSVNAPMPVAGRSKTDSFLVQLLQQHPQYFDSVLKNKKQWNVQFIYTQIDRGANGIPALKNYYFNVNPSQYFYPASTVKLPVS